MMRALGLTALGLLAVDAHATDITVPFSGKRPHTLEFHGGFAWYGVGVAGGLRYGIPIVDNGFIGPINNSIYLTFGADIYLLSRVYVLERAGIGLGIPVIGQWNFYFTDDWSAFGEVGINLYVDTYTFEGNGLAFTPNYVVGAVGGRYHLSEQMALIGRIGAPYASIGVELTL